MLGLGSPCEPALSESGESEPAERVAAKLRTRCVDTVASRSSASSADSHSHAFSLSLSVSLSFGTA